MHDPAIYCGKDRTISRRYCKADSRPCTCRGFMLALLLLLVLPSAVLAQTPRPKLAVLDFHDSSGQTLNQEELQYLSSLVRGAARASLPADLFIIMTRENIFDLLPSGTSLADCFDDCAIELGRNIGADYVATGEIARFADELRVVVTLHETNSGNLLGQVRAGATNVLAIESELEGQVSTLLQPLRGVGSAPQLDDAGRPIGVESQEWDPSFTIYHVVGFETDPPGAEVRIAGQYRGVTPCSRELTEGSHEITLRLPRYEEYRVTTKVIGPATIRRTLTPLFGWLSVATEPSGLPIMLDGQQIGKSPIVRHEVEPGRHTVMVEDSRYEPAGLEGFSVGSNEHQELEFHPTPRFGGLTVRAVTADSKHDALSKPVQIDGQEVGTTPWAGRLLVGRHRVTVEGQVREVAVVERETREEVFEVAVATAHRELVEMVMVPAGNYHRGSPALEEGRYGHETQHSVTISQPFFLAKTEVTQALWQRVMGVNPSRFKGDDLPVELVSWFDAVRFCNKLSELEGLDPAYRIQGREVTWDRTANGYRLPTEAEWEYACRAGTTTRYHAGNSESDLGRAGWYSGNSGTKTHPVAAKQANAWGLSDMHGNVWEWCWDWYGSYPSGQVTDPVGPSSGSHRVLRGGGWDYDARFGRSANRNSRGPSYAYDFVGFRLARSAF